MSYSSSLRDPKWDVELRESIRTIQETQDEDFKKSPSSPFCNLDGPVLTMLSNHSQQNLKGLHKYAYIPAQYCHLSRPARVCGTLHKNDSSFFRMSSAGGQTPD
jgi:hypothetical protein